MKACVIGLGSNEETEELLLSVREELCRHFPDILFSSLLHTQPVDFASPRLFWNCMAVCITSLPLEQIRGLLKQIEIAYGRCPEDKSQGIVKIDLDVLSYDGQAFKPSDWEREYVCQGAEELGLL